MNNVISLKLNELKKSSRILRLCTYGEVIINNIDLNHENNSVGRKHDFYYIKYLCMF